MTREQATNAAMRSHWAGNANQRAVREELGRRFDALDLDQQPNLVKSLLSITVAPGRGTGRVVVKSC